MENTATNKEVVNNANVEIETDALGVKPKPLNGGTTANRQLMAHIGPIRASIASKLGVRLDHMRISSKMWNVLKELEAEDRINKVIRSERAEGICREVRGGNTTAYVVYMSKEAKEAGDAKTLEDTLEDRAEKLEISKELLAKIDACWRLEEEYKNACTALHTDKEAMSQRVFTEDESVTAPAFRALEERAKAKKAQNDEEKAALECSDKNKIEELLKSEEAELSLLEDKLDEQRRRKTCVDEELAKEKDQCDTWEREAVALARIVVKSDEQETRDKELRRLRVKNLEVINEKKEEASKLEDSITQFKREKSDREAKIATYQDERETPSKRQRKA